VWQEPRRTLSRSIARRFGVASYFSTIHVPSSTSPLEMKNDIIAQRSPSVTEGPAFLERLRLRRRSTQPQCPITSTPPIPLWFFRIITLQTISRHRIESQGFTSIFFYCNSYNRVLPPARNLGKNKPSQLAVAQRPVFCHEPVVSDCQ